MKNRLVLIIIFLLSVKTFPQNHNIVGLFPTIDVSKDINNKWNAEIYTFLAVYPYEQTSHGQTYPAKVNSFYSEFDLSYNITDKLSTTLSYTYERVNPFRDNYRNENRIWLQLKHKGLINEKIEIENRLRYDFRFISNRLTNSVDFKPRVRYKLGLTTPIKNNYVTTYNEFFFNTFKSSMFEYSENWFFAGYGSKLTEKTTLEGGLLLVSWLRNDQKDWLNQYFLQVTLYHKL